MDKEKLKKTPRELGYEIGSVILMQVSKQKQI